MGPVVVIICLHRSSFSTLPSGRLLCSHRACPSCTLYGVLILSEIVVTCIAVVPVSITAAAIWAFIIGMAIASAGAAFGIAAVEHCHIDSNACDYGYQTSYDAA